jgi:hypothetical protein
MHVVIKSGMREHDQRAESKRPNGAGETKRDEPSLFPCGLDSSDLSPLATTTSEGHTAREEQAGNNTKHWKAKTRYLIIPLFSFSKYNELLFHFHVAMLEQTPCRTPGQEIRRALNYVLFP